jgi:hypothetical protein
MPAIYELICVKGGTAVDAEKHTWIFNFLWTFGLCSERKKDDLCGDNHILPCSRALSVSGRENGVRYEKRKKIDKIEHRQQRDAAIGVGCVVLANLARPQEL